MAKIKKIKRRKTVGFRKKSPKILNNKRRKKRRNVAL